MNRAQGDYPGALGSARTALAKAKPPTAPAPATLQKNSLLISISVLFSSRNIQTFLKNT